MKSVACGQVGHAGALELIVCLGFWQVPPLAWRKRVEHAYE